MEEILKGIASAFNMEADELTGLLKNEAGEQLTGAAVTTAISEKLKEEIATVTALKYKQGQGEQNAKIAKVIRAAGFQNPDKKQGPELVTAFIEFQQQQSEPGEGEGELTREKLEKNPIVKAIIADRIKAQGDLMAAQQAEFDSKQKAWSKEKNDLAMIAYLPGVLEKAGVILENEQLGIKREDRVKLALSMIPQNVEFKNGKPVIVDEDGNPALDEMGRPLDFTKEAVKITGATFGISKIDPSKRGANPPANGGQQQQQENTIQFKDVTEFNNYMMKETDPKKRLAAQQSFKAQQAAGGEQ